jgi:hypothetical protein
MERIFPKTVILSITTHGEILLNTPVTNPSEIIYTNGIPMNIPTFNVDPRIKEFYKFNAVAPGVINYVEGDGEIDVYDIERAHNLEDLFNESGNVTKINSEIRQFIVNNTIEKKQLMDSAEDIAEIVREVATNIVSEKKQDEKTMKKELKGVTDPKKLEELIDITEYLNLHDKSHLLVNCRERRGFMVNKTYILGKDDVSPSGGEDWSISCLNFPFLHSDIFNNILIWKNSGLTKPDKIPIKGADRGSVTLKDITDYLAEQGVTRLIIVDLTCSPFAIGDNYYSGRITRRFRNDILGTKTPYGGGTSESNDKKEDTKYICYTGIGSRKSGNHSKKQYLNIMNKHFKEDCSKYTHALKCKSCKKYKEMATRNAKKQMKVQLAKKTYKMSKKTEEKLAKQMKKCLLCRNKKTRKCDLKKYIEFSGAVLGKCADNDIIVHTV